MLFRFKNFFLITLFFGIGFFLLFFVVGISTPSSSLTREGSSNSESKSLVSEQKIGKRTKEDFKNKFKSYLKKFADYGIDEFNDGSRPWSLIAWVIAEEDGINKFTDGSKAYQIGHLTSLELEKDYINFSPDAKSQLDALYDEFIEYDYRDGGLLEIELRNAFNLFINKYRNTLKPVLELFKQYGISSFTLDGREYQLADLQKADLTSYQNTWGYTEEAHDELSALYKADIKHQQFKTALNRLMNPYKQSIQDGLSLFAKYNFVKYNITTVTLNNKEYQPDQLLNTDNLYRSAAELSPVAAKQLKILYDDNITLQHFKDTFNILINAYRNTLKKGLNLFKKYGVNNSALVGAEYQLVELHKANLISDSWGYDSKAHDELSALYKLSITPLHFTDAFNIEIIMNYKTNIQSSLNLFAKYGIINPNLDGKDYDLGKLLKADNIDKSAPDLLVSAAQQLGNLYKTNITPQHFEDAFNLLINKYRNTLKPGLDLFAKYDLSRATFNGKEYKFNSLFWWVNLTPDVQNYSEQLHNQLSALYKGKENSGQVGIVDFQTAFNTLINAYRTQLKPGLDLFAKYGLSSTTMDYELFQFVELHKVNLTSDQDAWDYVKEIHDELALLFDNYIFLWDFEVVFNILINQYRDQLKSDLDKFEQYGTSSVTLNGKEYQLANLQRADLTSDQNTWGYTEETHDELSALYKVDIKHQQFKTALNQILTARENQIQKEKEVKPKKPEETKKEKAAKQKAKETKKTKDKKTVLTIGLATSGGVLLLAGGAGGFLYWFYKIKK